MTISIDRPPLTEVHFDEQIVRSSSRPRTRGSRSTGAALAVLGIAFASISACAAGDEASTGPSSDTTEVVAVDTTADTTGVEPADTASAGTESATTEPAATEETRPPLLTDDGLRYINHPDPAITEPALAFCEAFGNLDEMDGVDQLMALTSDDIVFEDAVAGTTYAGPDEVRAHLTEFGQPLESGVQPRGMGWFTEVVCRENVVQGANWMAGSYIRFSGNSVERQGIAAVHVDDDGLIDRQVDFYSFLPDLKLQPTIDSGGGLFSVGSQYCRAWGDDMSPSVDDGVPDADEILSFMPADPTIHFAANGATTIAGVDEIRAFAEGTAWDRNECGLETQAVQWEAVANRFFDDDTGDIWEGVNVIALDENGLVTDHWPFLEPVS